VTIFYSENLDKTKEIDIMTKVEKEIFNIIKDNKLTSREAKEILENVSEAIDILMRSITIDLVIKTLKNR
jgi:hypothetical protein